ncbi:uncharacterized protein LOC128093066 [Culex pipiens pallens]|uniref:uncharacterized protein LOC128093066 n=1 Tax=Culex pipiens pallens TaxID=42434 RepID=UPI0022AA5626|nr:uncharacterized protein LOC128093066 [Culex pipiens pallens]
MKCRMLGTGVQHRPAGICTQPSYLESLCGVARQHQQRALHRIAVVRKQEVPTTASWPTLAKVPRPAVDSSNSFEQFNSRSSIQQIWFTGGGSVLRGGRVQRQQRNHCPYHQLQSSGGKRRRIKIPEWWRNKGPMNKREHGPVGNSREENQKQIEPLSAQMKERR